MSPLLATFRQLARQWVNAADAYDRAGRAGREQEMVETLTRKREVELRIANSFELKAGAGKGAAA